MLDEKTKGALLDSARKANKAKTGWFIVGGITIFFGTMLFSRACFGVGENYAISTMCRMVAEND